MPRDIDNGFLDGCGLNFLALCSSSYYVPEGRSPLPAGLLSYGSANDIVMESGKNIANRVKNIPLIAAVNATDPFILIDKLLEDIAIMGFIGVQNAPSVGIIDGSVRENLELSDMGYSSEVNLIALARSMGLLTAAYVFTIEQAKEMMEAGADMLIVHLGITSTEFPSADVNNTLSNGSDIIQEIIKEIQRTEQRDIFVLVHGGPLTKAEDVHDLFSKVAGLDGFFGSGLLEKVKTKEALRDRIQLFSDIPLG